MGGAQRQLKAGLGRPPLAPSSAAIASPRRPLGLQPARLSARRVLAEPRRPARRQPVGSARSRAAAAAGRLVPADSAGRRRAGGVRRRQPLAQRLAGRHLAEAQDEVGRRDPRKRRARAGHRWRRRGSGRAVRGGSARSARRGSGSRRRGREAGERLAQPGSSWRPQTIRPDGGLGDVPGHLVEQEAARARRRPASPRSTVARRGPPGPAGRSR